MFEQQKNNTTQFTRNTSYKLIGRLLITFAESEEPNHDNESVGGTGNTHLCCVPLEHPLT